MQPIASEILLNSYLLTHQMTVEQYEFVLNIQLYVVECVKLDPVHRSIIKPVRDSKNVLQGMLFELNHIRVNPKLDNTQVIEVLIQTFGQIGVRVSNRPHNTSMAICYKPLGEIRDNVRFYLNQQGKLIFLSPTMRPKLVYSKSEI